MHLSKEALSAQLDEAKKLVEIGAYYVHYRDPKSRYKVLHIGTIEATQEAAVIYENGSGTIWVRPLSSWLEVLPVGDAFVPRFQIWKN